MAFIDRYEIPPLPTAAIGSEEWHEQDVARQSSLAFIKPTDWCFYCGERLGCDGLIYWQGGDERHPQIWLHAECASDLVLSLAMDVKSARRHSGTQRPGSV